MPYAVRRLLVGDNADSWRRAGFCIEENQLVLGKVAIEFAGSEGQRGIIGWKLDAIDGDIDGIPTVEGSIDLDATGAQAGQPQSSNAVFAIDHVVVQTGDIDRTVSAFASAGLAERRSATIKTRGGERRQSVVWAGRVIIEILGPLEPIADAPSSLWGLALVSSNLQLSKEVLGTYLSEPRDAVQPGRKISTVNVGAFDISVPLEIMSPTTPELL